MLPIRVQAGYLRSQEECSHSPVPETTTVVRPCIILLLATAAAAVAAAPTAPSRGPAVGLAAVEEWSQLPCLQPHRIIGFSSHDPRGGNGDSGHYLGTVGDEHVLMDMTGPGCVYRIWFTGQDGAGKIRLYFDGEKQPRVEMAMRDFFSGATRPFLSPLCEADAVSSGGFICYLPLPFAQRLRITTTGKGHYYNIAAARYAPGTPVTTWTGREDSAAARMAWQYRGGNPAAIPGRFETARLDLLPGDYVDALKLTGGGVITGLHVRLPGLGQFPTGLRVIARGRAHKGTSEFRLKLDPNAEAVQLVRRLDFGVADQKASVWVDGVQVGEWFDKGSDGADHWRDSRFTLPQEAVRGKSEVTIKIKFVSSSRDWNEFRYAARCRAGEQETETDFVEVGDEASEKAHAYKIEGQTWSGRQEFTYPTPDDAPAALKLGELWLRIYWDGEAKPSVEAPLDFFFGSGANQAAVQALPLILQGEYGSCFFPMPFLRTARIQLASRAGEPVPGLEVTSTVAPLSTLEGDWGYLRTQYHAGPTTPKRDWIFLEAQGTGHMVGVVQNFGRVGGTLEGDERIYLDDCRTPAIYGTGTEDFYNGGWYFNKGRFTLATHGHPARGTSSSAYRIFFPDVVPFSRSIRAGIEHGGTNDVQSDYRTLAFYYSRPEVTATLTDMLDAGDPDSERAHAYQPTGASLLPAAAYQYEGNEDNLDVTDSGRSVRGTSQFVLQLAKENRGALLRRRLDYGTPDQEAKVFVDGQLAGTWLSTGSNTFHRWRDEEFLLPPSLTRGKDRITLCIEPLPREKGAWTEYAYWMYSLQAAWR
jgi:hypothetical protein